jgi:hypothetical protein
MKKLIASGIIILILAIVASVGYGVASSTLPWPEGPLYSIDDADPSADLPEDRAEMMEIIAGHYAHYDVVSYEDLTTRSPMRTFIVSYGFTEFYVEDGQLYQADRFVHAEQILNQKNTTSRFAGDSVQAIARRSTPVDMEFRDGAWRIYRPETPTLLGISGDPLQPLSRDRDDPALLDPDGDGNPRGNGLAQYRRVPRCGNIHNASGNFPESPDGVFPRSDPGSCGRYIRAVRGRGFPWFSRPAFE